MTTKERRILVNDMMVRALLDGSKTQTRQIIKPAPQMVTDSRTEPWAGNPETLMQLLAQSGKHCPFGQPGDRLWVPETWRTDASLDDKAPRTFNGWPVQYIADGKVLKHGAFYGDTNGKKRPSLSMPRWASRIMLEIVSVRVERLQDISEADAQAEGVHAEPCDHTRQSCADIGCWGPTAKGQYGWLWESINGLGSWAANPWVWVVEFKRISGDQS